MAMVRLGARLSRGNPGPELEPPKISSRIALVHRPRFLIGVVADARVESWRGVAIRPVFVNARERSGRLFHPGPRRKAADWSSNCRPMLARLVACSRGSDRYSHAQHV